MLDICANLIRNNLSDLDALEIGPGKNPYLKEKDFKKVIFVDNEFETETNNKINKNFLTFKSSNKFDVIFERLCWHEQNRNDWIDFLDNVIDHLKPGGLFISEHAISHKKMMFSEEKLYYNSHSMELIDNSKNKPIRFIPNSFFIESFLIKKNLNIKYFKIPFGKKVILERKNTQTKNTDPDLLQLIAQKSL